MFEGGDVGLVFDDIVLIGNEYPPASQGVRLRGCVLETSPCFCCSTALEPAFNSDVTSILTSCRARLFPRCSSFPSISSHQLLFQLNSQQILYSKVSKCPDSEHWRVAVRFKILTFRGSSMLMPSTRGTSRICRFNL
jgi:hypothetical protein